MGGFGPPPKENARRRNADTLGAEPGAVPLDAAPAPQLPTPKRWLKLTREWWAAWVGSAQSAHFTATDWQRLLALLPLWDSYYRLTVSANVEDTRKMRAAVAILNEIRQHESLLGAMHVDRLRGRMTGSVSGKGETGAGSALVFDMADFKDISGS